MPSLLPDASALPTIETERLTLRWLTPADATALFAVFGDPEVCRYWSRPALPDHAAAVALQTEIAELFAARTLFQWGVAERATGDVVGTATLASLTPEHGRAEVGYALARAVWGRGYAREALGALVAFAFAEAPVGLGLRRLEADVDPRNPRSARVLERAGFRPEGLQRARYLMAGEAQDAALYGLLRDERVPTSAS
jgi:RimJ/RimL family protein N-acetyltransferase